MRRIFLPLLLALLWALPALAQEPAKLRVAASFSIIADLAREVAGNRAEIVSLLEPGADMHGYDPSPADMRKLAEAQIIFVNGLGFEAWLGRVMETPGLAAKVVGVATGVQPRMGRDDVVDPHAWQDINNAILYVANIREGLIALDPAHATYYAANADRCIYELRQLNQWVKSALSVLPREKRRFITSHDALGYFADAYGMTLIAPASSVNAGGQVSASDLAALVDQMRSQSVKVVFLESSGDTRMMYQLAEDGGGAVGGPLYVDSLSGPSGPAPTYKAMMRYNVGKFVSALSDTP